MINDDTQDCPWSVGRPHASIKDPALLNTVTVTRQTARQMGANGWVRAAALPEMTVGLPPPVGLSV